MADVIDFNEFIFFSNNLEKVFVNCFLNLSYSSIKILFCKIYTKIFPRKGMGVNMQEYIIMPIAKIYLFGIMKKPVFVWNTKKNYTVLILTKNIT